MTTDALVAADQPKLASTSPPPQMTSQSVAVTSQSVSVTSQRVAVTSLRSGPAVAMATRAVPTKQKEVAMTTAPKIQELVSSADPRQRLESAYGVRLEGEVHLVDIKRGDRLSCRLGLCLAGNKDPKRMGSFVAGLLPDSPAFVDGRMRVGDLLIQVNEKVLMGRSHLHASAIINSAAVSDATTLTFVLLRHHNFRLHMATTTSLKLPPVQHKDDPSTCISKWPTSRSTATLQEATETCLTNGLPNVMHNLSVTAHDSSNSSVPIDRIICSHGNDGAARGDENQVNGNWVKKEPVEERLLKLGQGKEDERDRGDKEGKRQGVKEGQRRNVEGQGAQGEGQIKKRHELVEKGQQHDGEGQTEANKDQAEASVMTEQEGETKGQDEIERQCDTLKTPHVDGKIHDGCGNEKERRVQEEDKESHDVDLEGHAQIQKGHEHDQVVHVQNKERLKHSNEEPEQQKEGQEQDKEGQEQDKEGKEEQEKRAQDEEETSKTNTEVDDDEVGAGKELDKRDTAEEERENRDRVKEGGGEVQVLEKSGQEDSIDDGVKVEGEAGQQVKGQGQASDLSGGHDETKDEEQEESVVKTTSGERDQKWTNRLKAMEAHILSGSNPLHSSSLTEVPVGESEPRSSSTPSSSAMEDPSTCSITAGRETTIEIDKGRLALGVDVIGGVNTLLGVILVHEIYENGAAAKDGRLAIGDQIIEVNGELFHDITDELANEILRQTPPTVRLIVFREETPLREEEIYDLFNLDLLKKPGKGLGISIIGRHRDNGIFVSDVIKGGVADLDGQLMPGDQILVINGSDVRHVSQQFAAEMLKTLIGRVSLTVGRVKCLSRSTSRSSSSISEVDSDEEAAALASIPKKDHGKDKVKEKVTR